MNNVHVTLDTISSDGYVLLQGQGADLSGSRLLNAAGLLPEHKTVVVSFSPTISIALPVKPAKIDIAFMHFGHQYTGQGVVVSKTNSVVLHVHLKLVRNKKS